MQEIQPEVKKLQKEYKADREELNKQLMALYQERGVNPAAGCLPLLVQMPIWFALYRVLWQGDGIPEDSDLSGVIESANAALYTTDENGNLTSTLQEGVDINGEQFEEVIFLGLNLLVRPSAAVDFGDILRSLPYLILIAVIVAAGFYQQVQTTRRSKNDPNQEQNAQMQTMQRALRIMPVVFGFISWNFVSGLGLYFATSNVFRVGQQAVILRTAHRDPGDGGKGRGKQSDDDAPDDPPSEEPNQSGPSPNASKKRNRKRRK